MVRGVLGPTSPFYELSCAPLLHQVERDENSQFKAKKRCRCGIERPREVLLGLGNLGEIACLKLRPERAHGFEEGVENLNCAGEKPDAEATLRWRVRLFGRHQILQQHVEPPAKQRQDHGAEFGNRLCKSFNKSFERRALVRGVFGGGLESHLLPEGDPPSRPKRTKPLLHLEGHIEVVGRNEDRCSNHGRTLSRSEPPKQRIPLICFCTRRCSLPLRIAGELGREARRQRNELC